MPDREDVTTWLKHLPNKLTLARVAVIPLLIIVYPFDIEFLKFFSAGLFAVAAFTDFLDGYLARRYNNETRLGAILDPMADKILVTTAIILLTNARVLPAWIACLLLCREVAISGLRLIASEQRLVIKVSVFGKLKTVAQDVGIFCLLIGRPDYHNVGMIAIWVALGLSYFSAYQYWALFWHSTNNGQKLTESLPPSPLD